MQNSSISSSEKREETDEAQAYIYCSSKETVSLLKEDVEYESIWFINLHGYGLFSIK